MVGEIFPSMPRQGLYDPAFEHDACGVAFVAKLDGVQTHQVVEQGLLALKNLDHRGATGADPAAGDGAGILVQVPDAFLREVLAFELPDPGHYAVGLAHLPTDPTRREYVRADIARIAIEEGLTVLGWREVPVRTDTLSPISLAVMPHFSQLVVTSRDGRSGIDLDRITFVLRRRVQNEVGVYFQSLSSRTMVYKGMLTTDQLEEVFPDLHHERFRSALALVHSRFSTNTFPAWELAHPYRIMAHNGEINTVMGNRNWMRAREALLQSDLIPGDLARIFPICTPGGSDSASFDEVLELLHLGGRTLPHAVLMMIPEAWQKNVGMDPERRAFYEFHASIMEPWDGPASVTFTDGTLIGGVLDRNGLRPARYWVTNDGLVVFASEAGVLPIEPQDVVQKGRLQPGRMFLVDMARHRIIDDDEIKAGLAAEQPYAEWLKNKITLDDLPERVHVVHSHASVTRRQQVFGYSHEDLRLLVAPMANTGAEVIGSMGTDTPIAVLSDRPRPLFDYFAQLFAQVTNPPLDSIREELVTSLAGSIGPEVNLLTAGPESCPQLEIPYPILTNEELSRIVHINRDGDQPGYATHLVRGLYQVAGGGAALRQRLDEIRAEVSEAIAGGARTIVLSDRHSDADRAPIPSLLLTSAIHHHLVRQKSRTQVGLVVEAGDVREVHHAALLIGYGAAALNPYLMFESAEDMARNELYVSVAPERAIKNVVKGLGKGILKVMSKMGVSTLQSYTGAQIFEAIGLSREFVDEFFTGTASKIGGIGLDELAETIRQRHARAYPASRIALPHRTLAVGGEYQWRREGEEHLFDPESVFRLQHATATGRYDIFKQYTSRINENSERLMTLRALLDFRSDRPSIPIEEVEPASEIVKRFSTGAMSYGSISQEAHETLAIAMNSIGAKSNTGEGGEDSDRFGTDPGGDSRRSAIKQVASGRFGVTSEYLANADDIQIKIAQGAKPGEGGQLPGYKVYPWIAKTRHSTPGVGLISPPPHHDIYSIEDLAQLIFDLKCANPRARVHVKLVSETGVGTIAAGVAKAKADVILIAGHDGGTGAAPQGSVKHAGVPWELGLAETQQTLRRNGLRGRVVVQADGQMKTGRDVIVAALLGAEEFGFATAPLVVSGCIMMRVCHLDTCPVGIATQNPELRARFTGKPKFVETFFRFIAEEVREHLAALGLRSLEEAVGRHDLLDKVEAIEHWKAARLDLSAILDPPELHGEGQQHLRCVESQDHGLEGQLDHRLIDLAGPALDGSQKVEATLDIRNTDRSIGTMLGYEISRRFGAEGLDPGTLSFDLHGSAGQSLGAFLPRGVTLRLWGDANDYVGKGLSGGTLVLAPPAGSPFPAEENVIAGNVLLYGATSGEMFVRGVVGERLCVRNSGATVVVEGIGDHGCEYMTGGRAVVLGPVGRNFAAGMSGGIAYLLDSPGLEKRVNAETVDLDALDAEDREWLRAILDRHLSETGSAVASALLSDWGASVDRFVKVMPKDYKRVLRAAALAAQQGGSVDDAVMAAAHG